MNVHPKPPELIFLVDDHPLVRRGLTLVLEQEGFVVCGEADSPAAMLAHPNLASARIVILDLSFQGVNGMDFIPELCERGFLVIVYSMHEDDAVVKRAFAAGARGYLTKREVASSLSSAIRTVLSGQVFTSPRISEAVRNIGKILKRV